MLAACRTGWRGRCGREAGFGHHEAGRKQKEKAPSLFRLSAFAFLLTDPMLFWSALVPSDLRLPMSQVSFFLNFGFLELLLLRTFVLSTFRPLELRSLELSLFGTFVLSNFPVSFVESKIQ
jgi:hypothetical protein